VDTDGTRRHSSASECGECRDGARMTLPSVPTLLPNSTLRNADVCQRAMAAPGRALAEGVFFIGVTRSKCAVGQCIRHSSCGPITIS
jgi:hypothetical protein